MRVCDHLFIGNENFINSVNETLTNETGDMPIDDPERHSRSEFRVYIVTEKGGNAEVMSKETMDFLFKKFTKDSMYVECIGRYMIEINSHSGKYIERMKAWEKEKEEREQKWAHDNYAQNVFSNLSTMFGGDCE